MEPPRAEIEKSIAYTKEHAVSRLRSMEKNVGSRRRVPRTREVVKASGYLAETLDSSIWLPGRLFQGSVPGYARGESARGSDRIVKSCDVRWPLKLVIKIVLGFTEICCSYFMNLYLLVCQCLTSIPAEKLHSTGIDLSASAPLLASIVHGHRLIFGHNGSVDGKPG